MVPRHPSPRFPPASVAVTGLLCTLAVASGAAGCRAFDESLLDGTADAGAPCVPRTPPTRPGMASPTDVGERLFALRDVRLEQAGDWRSIGYNLDGLCSEEPEPEVECYPPDAEGGLEVDGDDGIDNAAGHTVFPFQLVLLGDMEAPVRSHQEIGRGVTLLRVRGYNGEPDDDRVDVAIAPAAWGSPPVAGGDPPELPTDGSAPPPPAWDGSDYWWATEASFLGGDPDAPLVRDDNAYVSDGTLVVHPPERVPFVFSAPEFSFAVRLTDAVITARLTSDGQGLEQVLLAGRWSIDDMLETFPTLGFCPGSVNEGRMTRLLDAAVDVRAIPGTGGPSVDCNAISVGIEQTGVAAQWAGLAVGPLPPIACR